MTTTSRERRRAAFRAAMFGILAFATALTAAPAQGGSVAAPAAAPALQDGFTPVGTFGAYRVVEVRDGLHEGARVRFVDMTLHNLSAETMHPQAIQEVWWQGRHTGDKVEPRRRDLSRFGMYDYMKPGQVLDVTYIMPVRSDIDGIRVDYMKAPKGAQERRWTWDELIAGAPGILYHKGRPVSAGSLATAPAAGPSTNTGMLIGDRPTAAAAAVALQDDTQADPALKRKRGLLGGLKGVLPAIPR